jgi:hypothetical protein
MTATIRTAKATESVDKVRAHTTQMPASNVARGCGRFRVAGMLAVGKLVVIAATVTHGEVC